MTFSCTSSSSSNFFLARRFFGWRNKWKSLGVRSGLYGGWSSISHVHLLRWEIVWRNASRIWRDFGSALPFQTRLTQTKPVLPLSNEHGSQVKDQGRRECCHNKHKNFPIGLHVMYLYFPDTPHTVLYNLLLFSCPLHQYIFRVLYQLICFICYRRHIQFLPLSSFLLWPIRGQVWNVFK